MPVARRAVATPARRNLRKDICVGLIVWATPRLARRCGVAEVSALWLGPCNPLLFMHLVAGIHNEALMLGLMLAGTEFALRGIEAMRAAHGGSSSGPPHLSLGLARWSPLALVVLGAVLITLSSQVKLPSLLALGFVAMALAHQWGGTVRAFAAASGLLGTVALAVMALIGWASGLGFGWLFTLGTANVVRSWMSPPTLLALGTGQVGILLGLGDHTTAVLALTANNTSTQVLSQTAIGAIDTALVSINTKRAAYGANQNALNSALHNLESYTENLVASESRIRDVDFAAETADMTRNSIFQQAGVSVLAQANQSPQVALQLLS